MMTRLSVNLNKVALLRNSRDTTIPSVTDAAKTAIESGACGITVHPRPDMRHIRPQDVYDLARLLSASEYHDIEFNIEGNPWAGPEDNGYPGFMALILEVCPHQATLVPDDPSQLTSDHGWDLSDPQTRDRLSPIINEIQSKGTRVSLFMDPVDAQLQHAAELGCERIEFYTGPYADAFDSPDNESVLSQFTGASQFASQLGLGINAGHDLNQHNLEAFLRAVQPVAEVSIGHAIISDALWLGLAETVRRYQQIIESVPFSNI